MILGVIIWRRSREKSESYPSSSEENSLKFKDPRTSLNPLYVVANNEFDILGQFDNSLEVIWINEIDVAEDDFEYFGWFKFSHKTWIM